MTIAEIHGKLKPYEVKEDLLTSDVFSAFKYTNPVEGLIPFLSQGKCFGKTAKKPDFLNNISNALYYFWPRSRNLLEPDLIIILETHDKRTIAVDVEAKYMSGKHNREVEADDSEPSLGKMTGDQLYDQYLELVNKNYSGLLCEKLQSCEEYYVFYITAHYVLPYSDINETKKICNDRGDDAAVQKFYWMNWQSAFISCGKSKNIVLRDLADLLDRKRLYELSLWNWIVPEIGFPIALFERGSFWSAGYLKEMNSIKRYLNPDSHLYRKS